MDFNDGARVLLAGGITRRWTVTLRDLDTGNILSWSENKGTIVSFTKRYFVQFGVEVSELDDAGTATPALGHEFDARDRDVLIHFPVGVLGDALAWFSCTSRFAEVHGCALSELIRPLLRNAYKTIRFATHDEVAEHKLAETAYATYYLGLFFDDAQNAFQPTDFRHVGLHRTPGYIVGVDPAEEAPHLALPDESPSIAEPYVCIAVQSTAQCEYWNNPHGWRGVIAFLKASGYRVICIHQKAVHSNGWSGPTFGMVLRKRPAIVPWRSERAGCAIPRLLSASAASCHGWHGRRARR